jgi:hypothetical protein
MASAVPLTSIALWNHQHQSLPRRLSLYITLLWKFSLADRCYSRSPRDFGRIGKILLILPVAIAAEERIWWRKSTSVGLVRVNLPLGWGMESRESDYPVPKVNS